MTKRHKWRPHDTLDIYFGCWRPLPGDILVICLEYSGLTGSNFFWLYF